MGRYYSGDIEGKFWFGTQPSNDAEQFGANQVESNYINYYVDDIQEVKSRLIEIFDELLIPVNLDLEGDDVDDLDADKYLATGKTVKDRDALMASLCLGLKIYKCVKDHGSCMFEAEC